MAGDWIPFDHDLERKEEVVALAETLLPEFGSQEAALAVVVLRLKRLWCWADRMTTDGVLRNISATGVALRCGGCAAFWEEVARVKWLAFKGGNVVIPGFAERFGASARHRLLAAKRMQASRARNSSATAAQRGAQQPAHPEPEPQPLSEPEQEPPQEPLPQAPAPAAQASAQGVAAQRSSAGPTHEAVVAAWNAIRPIAGLPGVEPCKTITAKRRVALGQRIKTAWWRDNWQAALAAVADSTFCHGGGKEGWRAGLDWFLRPDTAAKLLEGKYADREQGNGRHDPRGNIGAVRRYCDSIDQES